MVSHARLRQGREGSEEARSGRKWGRARERKAARAGGRAGAGGVGRAGGAGGGSPAPLCPLPPGAPVGAGHVGPGQSVTVWSGKAGAGPEESLGVRECSKERFISETKAYFSRQDCLYSYFMTSPWPQARSGAAKEALRGRPRTARTTR